MIKRIVLEKYLFFLYLFFHVLPFFYRESYKTLTWVNYSVILFFWFIVLITKKKLDLESILYVILVVVSMNLAVLGFSGSIISLILAASIPHFVFKKINSDEDFITFFTKPIIYLSIILLLSSLSLYSQVKNQLENFSFLGEYFVIASINYVPLVLNTCCLLFFLLIHTYKRKNYIKKVLILIFGLLLVTNLFFCFIFLTRSVLISTCILVLLTGKQVRRFIILMSLFVFFIHIDFESFFSGLIVFFGSDNLIEIASDNRRYDSVLKLIHSSFSLGFNFRENMSYSSFLNLIFSLFPLTLIFLYTPYVTIKTIFVKRDVKMLFYFLASLIVVIYQMDFLSIFTFYFISNYIIKVYTKTHEIQKHASQVS